MIETILGKIKKEEVGVALPHEHILCDLRPSLDLTSLEPHFHEKLSINNRYVINNDPYLICDNAFYDDEEIAVKELEYFKACGGNTIFDCTTFTPDYKKLMYISKKSGVNVVMGTGYYVDCYFSDALRKMTVEERAEKMIKDITVGFDGADCKAGFIGEIGTSEIITEDEWKNVEAAALASLKTGASIHFHTALWERNGIDIIKKVTSLGVRPQKICIDHIDVNIRQDYIEELLDLGAYVEFDNFGKEFFIPKRDTGVLRGRFAYDYERCVSIKSLIDKGYINRILLTTDICLKSMLISYGGNGFAHVIRNIPSMLKDVGITQEQIKILLESNPADFFDVK